LKPLAKATIVCLVALGSAISSVTAAPPAFQLDAQAKRALVGHALALHAGDTVESVIASLGKPTYDQTLTPKQSSEPIARTLKYYAVVWETGRVNEIHDQLVDIVFDADGRLQRIDIQVSLP
jgi:hypothetical protein